MQITKIVNNNIVISEDKNHKEVVLMGKGLGFQKHKGDEIKSSQIEKTYVMKDHGMTSIFSGPSLVFEGNKPDQIKINFEKSQFIKILDGFNRLDFGGNLAMIQMTAALQ